jgi:precorrin-2 dehydrogenase/sirohydrochlorin ferrochelatase
MPDYPILLQLHERLCVVVGGGPVGRRKARGLVQTGARVRLIDYKPAAPGEDLEGIEIVSRPYRPDDLEGAFLVFAATGEREVNAAVALEARRRGILFNVADAPGEGDFTLPALLRRGELTVAVSTGGQSPALAALIRDRLSGILGPEWATVLEIAAALRQKRLTLQGKTEYNQAILRRLLDGHLPELIAGGKTAGIDRLLKTLFGEGFSLAELGIHLPKGMT